MKHKKIKIKERNWAAIAAWNQPGAGTHKDKRSYNRKRDKKVSYDE